MTKRREAVAAIAGLSMVSCIALTAQAPPKPSAEHQRLAYFVGKWTNQGEMKAGPFGPGGKTMSTDTCEWFEGQFAVMCRSEGKSPFGPMKSVGIMSYSAEEKVYTYYATDNSGMTMTKRTARDGQGRHMDLYRRPEGQGARDAQRGVADLLHVHDGDAGRRWEMGADGRKHVDQVEISATSVARCRSRFHGRVHR